MARMLCLSLIIGLAVAGGAQAEYDHEQNIVYKNEHGVGLVMDVFRPKENANGLAIVDTLSGAWYSGQGQFNDHMRAGVFDVMTDHGFTVFMIRPGSRTKFTAKEMIDNMIEGMRYVRAHAEDYGIDPERVGIMGASAGGHLSLLTALAEKTLEEDGENPPVSLAALAVFFPPTDFLTWGEEARNLRSIGNILYNSGAADKSDDELAEAARAVSPALLDIPADYPPSLLIHGDADDVVPLQQSEVMIDRLNEAGVENQLIIEEGGGHAWLTIREDVETMAQWFEKHLGAK